MVTSEWWQTAKEFSADASLLSENEPLAPKTTMRVGGVARYYAEPASVADLIRLRREARNASVPIFYLGRGSNLIVMDAGYPGLVIRLTGDAWQKVSRDGNCLIASAGTRLKKICAEAAKAGLSGFEFIEGIPGALGGSLRMNAGAMGGWVFDLIESVTCIEDDDTVVEHPVSFFHSSYRSCPELSTRIVIEARLVGGLESQTDAIRGNMSAYALKRKESQPREPSAGCIFKNPEPHHAGQLVDAAGLKGMSVGGAEVSPTHANFIVNKGGASASDVIELVRQVRKRVFEKEGVHLEPEALLLGAEWKDVL
jgi:UDP-N-acetylenolpyruvoylglucosamine reductase|tara:strand:- start:1076 stop:2008 length:933 start_codon:yes stop_codon:yes gene_type:complete